MNSHPPSHTDGPGLALLPFGGLGLDLEEVRRKVSGLLLVPFPQQEKCEQETTFDAPPVPSGYSLLIRLCRETLGS